MSKTVLTVVGSGNNPEQHRLELISQTHVLVGVSREVRPWLSRRRSSSTARPKHGAFTGGDIVMSQSRFVTVGTFSKTLTILFRQFRKRNS